MFEARFSQHEKSRKSHNTEIQRELDREREENRRGKSDNSRLKADLTEREKAYILTAEGSDWLYSRSSCPSVNDIYDIFRK